MKEFPGASRLSRSAAPRAVSILSAVLLTSSAGASAYGCQALPKPVPPYDTTVRQHILPEEEKLLLGLVKEGRRYSIEGVRVFNGSDKFLPGKIAIALADYLVSLPAGDSRLPAELADYRAIARMTLHDPNHTWGIYYYLLALSELRKAGLLEQAVDSRTLAQLRTALDWRTFVDRRTGNVINLPNNYYVVAFAIARLRHVLGWEGAEDAARLYARIEAHYRRYSGRYGFADETDGEGRFDRYSVLLAGEIANHFLETGGRPPAEAIGWLRRSAALMMSRLHANGEGFEYGRSLGPYADTAIIETLTAAARLGVLSRSDRALAYAYASSAAERYVDFWVDPRTGSVNLWDDGRRTDDYRGKFRILGENLSLAHQFAYTDQAWNRMGYRAVAPMRRFAAALRARPYEKVTWFARGNYDRVLITWRDGCHVIGLPLIDGGKSQHMHNPYFPIPFSRGMLEGVPDGTAPLLVPRIELSDGTVLMPLAYFRDVQIHSGRGAIRIVYRQAALDRMGRPEPLADSRFSLATRYELGHGRITRTDTFSPAGPLRVADIRLEFGTFSSQPRIEDNHVLFGRGQIVSFAVAGLAHCRVRTLHDERRYETDTAPMASLVTCTSGARLVRSPFTIRWSLTYH
jgi:hypothetical protein